MDAGGDVVVHQRDEGGLVDTPISGERGGRGGPVAAPFNGIAIHAELFFRLGAPAKRPAPGNGWFGWSDGEAGGERIGGIDEVLAETGHPSAAGDLRNDAESPSDLDFLEDCAGESGAEHRLVHVLVPDTSSPRWWRSAMIAEVPVPQGDRSK